MIDQVRPADLAAWIQSQEGAEGAVVLDVREPAELRAASLHADERFELVAIPMSTKRPPRTVQIGEPLWPWVVVAVCLKLMWNAAGSVSPCASNIFRL